jgi:hypothetical protein
MEQGKFCEEITAKTEQAKQIKSGKSLSKRGK